NAGEFTFTLFVVIAVSLLVSWIVAVLFTPLLGVTILPARMKGHHEKKGRLAQMFARAGIRVTLVCRSRLLPEAEPEISIALTRFFADEGVEVVSGVAYRSIGKTETGVALALVRDGREATIDAEKVLCAAGRAPNTEGLGLAELGIKLTPNGAIVVDDRMRTNRTGV
ncbi:FAD-dependent oxidoreductase, partial [Staphylococcus capitis]|uniref:FAD-dependent oxidoreductase n=1 Tax=Staphylococcus capitis TaxID=29388 RepID=UPI001B7D669E